MTLVCRYHSQMFDVPPQCSAAPQFTVRKAQVGDTAQIIELLQKAYFQNDERSYYRNPSETYRREFGVSEVPNRFKETDKYTMFVCVKTQGSIEQIVGTVYLQFAKTAYPKEGKDQGTWGEIGKLAVAPDYQKHYGISAKLLKQAELEAKERSLKHLYLYLVGPIGKYNQDGLKRYYEKNGYNLFCEFQSDPRDSFKTVSNPSALIKLIVMNKKLD